jgi:NAD(P)-dependent dehydrogenase (short-subunit alcohol dehydrogenase family)
LDNFAEKIAVITGAASGMGRELAVALASEGCHLALCDLSAASLSDTIAACEALGKNVRVSAHACDVSSEEAVLAFRDGVRAAHDSDAVHLLFNNAGIGGGGSFVLDERSDWDRTFGVCWFGVYYCSRAFLPMLMAADEAHLVNTSSINGFWASLGPNVSHTAYSAAKFAVKGFSEALITDLRINAPHVSVSVVMPGHIGTNIAANTGKVLGKPDPDSLNSEQLAHVREAMVKRGLPMDNQPDEFIRAALKQRAEDFRTKAPMSATEATEVILDGVREKRWRILVGDDAYAIDELVRDDPEGAYENELIGKMTGRGHLQGIVGGQSR